MINENTAVKVREILEINKAERHLRGGEATKRKYRALHTVDGGEALEEE